MLLCGWFQEQSLDKWLISDVETKLANIQQLSVKTMLPIGYSEMPCVCPLKATGLTLPSLDLGRLPQLGKCSLTSLIAFISWSWTLFILFFQVVFFQHSSMVIVGQSPSQCQESGSEHMMRAVLLSALWTNWGTLEKSPSPLLVTTQCHSCHSDWILWTYLPMVFHGAVTTKTKSASGEAGLAGEITGGNTAPIPRPCLLWLQAGWGSGWDFCLQEVCYFAGAPITKYHRLRGLNNRNFLIVLKVRSPRPRC